MGNQNSLFESETLRIYQECTFFTSKQICHIYKRFSSLNPEKINPHQADLHTRLSFTEVQNLPELRENPFKSRICEVFSTDGSGLSFEDFLDLCSVFSEGAPWELKSAYAFRIYDFNCDAYLCQDDIEETLISITSDNLTNHEIKFIVDHVIQEADLDQDEKLSYVEFEHVVSRAPDFVDLFRMTI